MNPIRANATDIDQWADRREAQATLPRLMRRLVLASVTRVESLYFRSDEGIQLAGWDGIVQVLVGNAHVPDGLSGWELSTNADIRGKADGDYEKRSKDPHPLNTSNASFVSVTARRWSNKETWADEKRREGVWRDVRAYDADDLDTWLEMAPAVDLWFSILLGKRPTGAVDLNSFWDSWSKATRPQLIPDLLIAGREDNLHKIHQWLRSGPSILGLQADTQNEAIAYFIATLFKMQKEEQESIFARTIIVEDAATWRRLAICNYPLILIPTFSDRSMVAAAVEIGHSVVYPLDRSEPSVGNTLSLTRISREEAKKALIAMGIDEPWARALSSLAWRSLGALRRKCAVFPNALTPEWSKKPEIARSLLPALLAGRWDEKNIADQEVIACLAGCEYSTVREILISWNQKPDPPVRLVDHTWIVAAREDAWLLLARFLTDDILERFRAAVIGVLGELDPQFELPLSERWLANIHGKTPKHSVYLRGGLAETLALMAASKSGQSWANSIVSGILDLATDWKLWASLSPFLPLLAEAAPEVLLEAIDNDLSSTSPSLVHLFIDSESNLSQSSPHTGLLWALEVLAWSPDYLSQSALLLARLARMDPGGKLSNRPLGSLQMIFLAWHPCTTASLERRLRVLDIIGRREPHAAWNLLASVHPYAHSVAFPTDKPKYRNWIDDKDLSVPIADVLRASTEIVRRILKDVGTDGTRWRTVIELLDDLPKIDFEAIIEHLLSMDLEALPQHDRLMIWNALREQLSHHLQFPDAKWVLPQVAIERIRQCYVRFEPGDPILKRIWLFSRRCSFPEGGASRGRERENMINRARTRAVEELFDIGGHAMLLRLSCKVDDCYCLGWSLSQSRIFDRQETMFLSQGLGSTEAAQRDAFAGLLNGLVVVKGKQWLDALRSSEIWNKWTLRQRVDYYIMLPFVQSTWDALEKENGEIEHSYWLNVGINGRGDLQTKDCELVTVKLAEHGRLGSAVDFISLYRKKMSNNAKLVADVLDRVIRDDSTENIDWGSMAYEVSELLDLLEASNEIEEAQIGQFEWYFLPLLRNHGRPPKILHKALAKDPEFFAEVLKWPYLAKGEEPGEPNKERSIRARLGYDLLQSWIQPPGVNEDRSVDHKKLASWISRARELSRANGRGDIADLHIGQVLAHYPNGIDGVWPHEALRDLIEDLGNEKIEKGIIMGISESRGVTCRSFFEGGDQEKAIAERYINCATILKDNWPRTARLMKKIADEFEFEASLADRKAELDEEIMG
ncbi:MAG TPA: hypothetical protein PKV33_02605 [Methanothrix sp.]|nr:hypothetical protein [Methanothrix sp.]